MSTPSAKINFTTVRSIFFFILIGIFGLATLYIFQPFLYPIFWAAVIAGMFYPLYSLILRHIKMPGISSGLTLIIITTVLFFPLTIISILLVQQSVDLYRQIAENGIVFSINNATAWLANTPLAPYQALIMEQYKLHAINIAKYISTFIFQNFAIITQASATFFFQFFIMMYTLYYFLKDGPHMIKRLAHLSPLGDTYEALLFDKFSSTARATLKSTVIVGGIQGILGGLLFWATGVQAPIVWGIIMTALSVIPGLGPFVIWMPAAVIMLIIGNIPAGLTILIGGSIISVVDNFLRPLLLGKDTQMHPLVILLSTLGGIFLFGISGFIIGPIVAALFIAVINMYSHYYKKELNQNKTQ